jgi:hypothetical protein
VYVGFAIRDLQDLFRRMIGLAFQKYDFHGYENLGYLFFPINLAFGLIQLGICKIYNQSFLKKNEDWFDPTIPTLRMHSTVMMALVSLILFCQILDHQLIILCIFGGFTFLNLEN